MDENLEDELRKFVRQFLDEFKPGYYWVFGKQIDGVEVYIKLKIAGLAGAERAVCLSFHKAERPLSYPFTN